MTENFDVFLSYHWRDQREVHALAEKLRGEKLNVFLDRWYLTPGQPWPQQLEMVLRECSAVVVCVGPGEMGPWQQREKYLALERQGRETGFPVIPVLLSGADPALGFLGQNTWVDLRSGLDQPLALAILAAAIRRQPPGPDIQQRLQEIRSAICPYKGLAYFREEDAEFFFSRDKAIATLLTSVERKNFVAVVGASGSGKSSVVRAGLIPKLRQDIREPWEIVTIVPTDRPFYSLAAHLLPLLEPDLTETDQLIESNKQTKAFQSGVLELRDVIERILRKQSGTKHFLLVVDQWEELYTLAPAEESQKFIDNLLMATKANTLRVVLTLRGDFMGHAISHRPLSDRLQDTQVNLGPMRREELKTLIEKPAEKVGASFEPGLVERILDDVGEEPGHLPLLEFVLQQLWDDPARHGGKLRHAAYDAMGGLEGALAKTADAVYDRLNAQEKQAVQRIFLQLVIPGEKAKDTRRRARFEEFASTQTLVKQLADARLLVTNNDGSFQVQTVEVAHEALIQHWSKFQDWLADDRAFLVWRRRQLRALMDSGDLLQGNALLIAKQWYEQRASDLDDDERYYISGSIDADETNLVTEQKKAAQDHRRKQLLFGAVALAFSLVTAIGGWGYQDWQRRRPIYRENDYVRIEPGEFMMGSPDTDTEAFDFEKPQHRITITKPFLLSKYEVTFEEYDRFAYDTGRRYPGDQGFGSELKNPEDRKRMPVINVSWHDAVAYANWLSQKTGLHFRLPTEAEWEYAAHADSETRRFWGDGLANACEYANVFDAGHERQLRERYGAGIQWDAVQCDDGYAYLAPVGKFKFNPWRLHDMLGNVFEWVEDCWHENYRSAPMMGGAWKEENEGDCTKHVTRGGSWVYDPQALRSAFRGWDGSGEADGVLGFRLAREL